MRKFLTTGLFSAILGIVIGVAPADASLVSRSFLDQALTDYATTTALDLKANQSDFTDLNTQISDSVDVLKQLLEQGFYSYEFVNGTINPEKFPNTISGAFGLLHQYLDAFAGSILHGWTDSNGTSYAGFAGLNNGWTDSEKKTYLGVKGLNDKIGTLPSGDMRPSKGLAFLLPDPEYQTYPTSIGDFMEQMYGGYLGLSGLAEAVYHGNTFMGQTDTALQVKGLRQITDEIGTLPSGNFPMFPGSDSLFPELNQPLTYPTSLAELITAIYGNSETGVTGLLEGIIPGVPFDTDGDGQLDTRIGTLPNYSLATRAIDLANANATKIGTLPSGNVVNSPLADTLNSLVQNTENSVYPDSLAKLIEQIYGNTPEHPGILTYILHGYPNIDGAAPVSSDFIGIVPAIQIAEDANILATTANTAANAANTTANAAKTAADANTAKIGVLPPDTTVAGMMGNPVLLNREQTIIPLYNLILRGSNGQIALDTMTGMTLPFPLLGLLDLTAKVNKIGTLPGDYENVGDALTTMDGKIGTLPDGYDSVGAALTAIKGIAEDAKAAALAAIPDPKQEGSTGKYVLTVDIVGDNATYRWEKIDREGETTTTTE